MSKQSNIKGNLKKRFTVESSKTVKVVWTLGAILWHAIVLILNFESTLDQDLNSSYKTIPVSAVDNFVAIHTYKHTRGRQ